MTSKFANESAEDQMLREAVSETVNRLFAQMDMNENGFLSSNEIENFVKLVITDIGDNANFQEDDIEGFIEMVDNDRDGKISKEELIDFVMGMFSAMVA